MAHSKQASKRKRRKIAFPVIGVAGASLALAGGAAAINKARAADLSSPNVAPPRAVTLDEEEISDVSLATFYVFDKEADGILQDNVVLARACGGCRGCGRCGGVARCGGARCAVARCARCGVARCAVVRCGVGIVGCAGCGGCSCSCCLSWGACRIC